MESRLYNSSRVNKQEYLLQLSITIDEEVGLFEYELKINKLYNLNNMPDDAWGYLEGRSNLSYMKGVLNTLRLNIIGEIASNSAIIKFEMNIKHNDSINTSKPEYIKLDQVLDRISSEMTAILQEIRIRPEKRENKRCLLM